MDRILNLTEDQLAFFKKNGYLMLADILDSELCAEARERLWSTLPKNSKIKRNELSTHLGPFSGDDTEEDVTNLRQGYKWQVRFVGTEKLLIDLVFSETLKNIAEQLLGEDTLNVPKIGGKTMGGHGAAWPGGPVDPALDNEGARGIYATLPYGDKPKEQDLCHTDGHPFNLSLVGLVDEVPPNGGAFKVWPGSHKRLYPTFQMQYDQPRIAYYEHIPSYKGIIQSVEYEEELKKVMEDTLPIDCWGSEGDVVLWHHRLAHMAGHNYSDKIRQAVLYDFTKKDLDTNRAKPPQKNMWEDWSEALNNAPDTYSEDIAKSQRLID